VQCKSEHAVENLIHGALTAVERVVATRSQGIGCNSQDMQAARYYGVAFRHGKSSIGEVDPTAWCGLT